MPTPMERRNRSVQKWKQPHIDGEATADGEVEADMEADMEADGAVVEVEVDGAAVEVGSD